MLDKFPLVCETRGRVIYLGEIMRIIYLSIGFISLALAVIGVVLPLLPTTPFLLLAIACFLNLLSVLKTGFIIQSFIRPM